MPPKISLIIPVYNAQPYISRCLESCINQSFKEIEIIIVDDCGSDDSIHIAKEYATKDLRIRIIHNAKNLGTFAARIEGIKHAKGEYICFIDADDYISLDMCENLQKKTYNKPDIIHFGIHYKGNKNATFIANLLHKSRYILPTQLCKIPLQKEQIAYNFFLRSYHFPKFTLWDKCYKRSLLIHTLDFLEAFTPLKLAMAEDMLHFFVIALLAQSYVSLNKHAYIYCLNQDSITQSKYKNHKKITDTVHVIEALHDLAQPLNTYNHLSPQIIERMSANLSSLIILESRFTSNGGGGYTYKFQNPKHTLPALTPYGTWPYHLCIISAFLYICKFIIYTLLSSFTTILETLSNLYSSRDLYLKFYTYQTLGDKTYLSIRGHTHAT